MTGSNPDAIKLCGELTEIASLFRVLADAEQSLGPDDLVQLAARIELLFEAASNMDQQHQLIEQLKAGQRDESELLRDIKPAGGVQ